MKQYKILVLQESYEYYDCAEDGAPISMVDHNYDLPYRYVVRETDEDIDIETFDSYEEAKQFAMNYGEGI